MGKFPQAKLWSKHNFAALALVILTLPAICWSASVQVTSTADSGAGSLRDTLLAANAGDTITFNLTTNNSPPFPLPAFATIDLSSPLAVTKNNITIDGTTQTAGGAVEINGDALTTGMSGILVTGTGCTIKGLVINRCPNHGIDISGNTNTIVGNKIGTNFFGNTSANNGGDGIHVTSANNVIGGTTSAARNILSGNINAGIELTGATCTGNIVQGNYCGLNNAGSAAIGNFDGILVTTSANGNTIGGTATGAGNVASGNAHDGIHTISSNNTTIQGNFVGVDATGTKIITDSSVFGIEVSGCSNTLVGGTVAGARNVVGGNAAGIELDAASTNNTVQGNNSGVGADNVAIVGNRLHGIVLRDNGVLNNLIGGTAAGAGNNVRNNGTGGIAVFNLPGDSMQSVGNAILGNSIYLNGRSNPAKLLGIDLVNLTSFPTDDANTPNHNPISTTGPNNFQNYPILTSAIPQAGGGTIITGTLFAKASTAFRVEFFGSATASGSGFGEGETFLGFASVTTDASGNATFTSTVSGSAIAGQVVSATATDPSNNTSEFSNALAVIGAPAITSPLTATGTIGTAFTYTITATNNPTAFTASPLPAGLTFSNGTINGTPTGGGVFHITIGASNASGSTSQVLTLTVMAVSGGGDGSLTLMDSDGDGFPDELESALASDPLNALSTPLGGTPAGTAAIGSPKLSLKLNFAKPNSDAFSLTGTLTVASGTTAGSKALTVDIGGIISTITLDARGSGSQNQIKAKVTVKNTTAKFSVKGSKAGYAAFLTDEGFTNVDSKKVAKTVPVIVIFNNTAYKANVAQTYTAKANKSGASK